MLPVIVDSFNMLDSSRLILCMLWFLSVNGLPIALRWLSREVRQARRHCSHRRYEISIGNL